MDLSSDEEEGARPVADDVEWEAAAAANLAIDIDFEMEPLKDRKNKCHCTLFNGRNCIERFTQAEQDSIRY